MHRGDDQHFATSCPPPNHEARGGRLTRLFLAAAVVVLAAASALAQSPTPAGPSPSPTSSPLQVKAIVTPRAEPILAQIAIAAMAEGGTPTVTFDARTIPSLAALRAICRGGPDDPRLVLSARPMPIAMTRDCETRQHGELVSIELGRDPIILAVRVEARLTNLTPNQIYQALARDVAAGEEFRRNVAIRWSDIDRSLPPIDIRFQLPPSDDNRRNIFDSLVLEDGCRVDPHIKYIYEASQRTARCLTTRIDRVREIAREHAVRALLDAPPGTVGVIGARDLAHGEGKLVALSLSGVPPTPQAIQAGTYGFAASQWLHVRLDNHPGADPAVNAALDRIVHAVPSEAFIGPDGRLIAGGLVPLAADEREAQRTALAMRDQGYDLAWFAGWVTTAFSSTLSLFGQAVTDLRTTEPVNKVDLAKLMETAGYKLAEFESSVGLIPGAGMTFKISREMSDSDREFLERELYRDARSRPGLRSALQRRLIQAIVDISESDGYVVSKVDVTLLPLPSVKLSITPRGGGASDTAAVLRAIERLEERLPEAMR